MENKELRRLQKLEEIYKDSQIICPPDEWLVKQRKLLRGIAEYLLIPYYEELDSIMMKLKPDSPTQD